MTILNFSDDVQTGVLTSYGGYATFTPTGGNYDEYGSGRISFQFSDEPLLAGDPVTYQTVVDGVIVTKTGLYVGFVRNIIPGAAVNPAYPVVTTGGTTTLLGLGYMAFSGSLEVVSTSGAFPECFVRGALILTLRGEIAVEALTGRDCVVTASGHDRPIRWIGRRSYAGRFLAANPGAQPVRFHAGSLGDGLPRRDLMVSPEHAMFLDGVLVPAKALVNGGTITAERGLARVDYFHVELDSHDVLLAEGAPSESYLEDGNRGRFHNAAERAALDRDALAPGDRCAPWVDSGFELEAIRARLANVAAEVARAA